MENVERLAVDADSVGREFTWQYLKTLVETPEHLWRFYSDTASYRHVDAGGAAETATADCGELCLLAGARYDALGRPPIIVRSVNASACAPDRILVMVTTDRFVQSFVLQHVPPVTFVVVATVVRYYGDDDVANGRGAGNGRRRRRGSRNPADAVDRRADQLFVGHLPDATTAEDLKRTFSVFGDVVYARVLRGTNRTGNPARYRYGFVRFGDPKDALKVLAYKPITLWNGYGVNVHLCPKMHSV